MQMRGASCLHAPLHPARSSSIKRLLCMPEQNRETVMTSVCRYHKGAPADGHRNLNVLCKEEGELKDKRGQVWCFSVEEWLAFLSFLGSPLAMAPQCEKLLRVFVRETMDEIQEEVTAAQKKAAHALAASKPLTHDREFQFSPHDRDGTTLAGFDPDQTLLVDDEMEICDAGESVKAGCGVLGSEVATVQRKGGGGRLGGHGGADVGTGEGGTQYNGHLGQIAVANVTGRGGGADGLTREEINSYGVQRTC